jgi:uncharacterized protein (TIGR00369 family)
MAETPPAAGRTWLDAALKAGTSPAPFFGLMHIRFVGVGDGTATFEMESRADLYNPYSVAHGGAIASLADSAMGFSVVSTLAGDERFTTAELHLNFIRAVTVESGSLRSVGRVVHRGRQVVVAEAEVFDAENRLVARATSTNIIMAAGKPAPVPEITPVTTAPMPAQITEPAQTKQWIRTSAGDMAYIRRGQGPPVVLLHGIPSSSYIWRDVIDPLAARFDVLAPDLIGYGDSDKRLDADFSLAAQARYVVAFMESVGVHQAAIVGHDIGGGIAQLMAADEPDRVARLILIDSVVDDAWPIPDIARLKEPVWDQIMVNLDLRSGLKKGLSAGIVTPGRVTEELVDEWLRPFSDQPGRRAYLRAARALNNRDLVSRSKHIEDIETPTLILWGAGDKFLDPGLAEKLRRKLSRAQPQVEIIDPGGHFLPIDRPEEVSAAIIRFLAGPPSAPGPQG